MNGSIQLVASSLVACVVDDSDIDFRARRQTVANDTLFAGRPRGNNHR